MGWDVYAQCQQISNFQQSPMLPSMLLILSIVSCTSLRPHTPQASNSTFTSLRLARNSQTTGLDLSSSLSAVVKQTGRFDDSRIWPAKTMVVEPLRASLSSIGRGSPRTDMLRHNTVSTSVAELDHELTRDVSVADLLTAIRNVSIRGETSKNHSSSKDVKSMNLVMAVRTLWNTGTMRFASFCGGTLAVFLIVFECIHLRYSNVDFDAPFTALTATVAEQQRSPGFFGTVGKARDLWHIYFRQASAQCTVFVIFSISLLLFQQYANNLMVTWHTDFWNNMQEWGNGDISQSYLKFYAFLLQFLFIGIIQTCASVYASYITSMFQLHARTYLTNRYVDLWIQKGAYYRLEISRKGAVGIDNPDERIQADVDAFIGSSITLLTAFLSSALQLCLFATVVWKASPPDAFGIPGLHIPGWLFWAVFIWGCLVTCGVVPTASPLKGLDAASLRSEADFRFELATIRTHAETIALASGEAVHAQLCSNRLDMIRRCIWETMFVNKRYGIVFSFFDQCQVVFVMLILGRSYLAGRVTLGTLMSTDYATGLIASSLMWFPNSYGDILGWQATTSRLFMLEDGIMQAMKSSTWCGAEMEKQTCAEGLAIEDLKIMIPQEADDSDDSCDEGHIKMRPLLEKLDLELAPGTKILISGASGAGKSSLVRSLAGIWPYAEGRIRMPDGHCGSMFFPTEPYLPHDTLRAVLAYPMRDSAIADEPILEVLELMQLHRLSSICLDSVRDWNSCLSHGEKARVALARLVLHKPRLAVLDEPLSHLPDSQQGELLRLAMGELPGGTTVIMISHELGPDIISHFDARYDLDPIRKALVKQ